jgi:serine protease AprX
VAIIDDVFIHLLPILLLNKFNHKMKHVILLLIISFGSFLNLMATEDYLLKIDKSLISRYEQKEKAEYIILLKNRKSFQSDLPFNTKNEKATYVYNTLLLHARKTQGPIINILKHHNLNYQSFYVTNAIKVVSNKETMILIAKREDVEKIIDNAPFKMLDYKIEKATSSSRSAEPEWGIKKINADSVWSLGFRGQGVVIAGQDTGYEWEVSPLKSKYKGYVDSLTVDHNYHWHDAIKSNSPNFPDTLLNPCGYATKTPCDDNNHGTHTMGTMVGEDDENSIGVAPEAKWIACRNMDRGWGQPSTYMECFEWFLAPYDLDEDNADPSKSPHVINNSWFCSEEEGCNPSNIGLMEDIVKNLKASGVVVVVSAGNSGGNGCGSVVGPPAFFESSFSVGATNIEDNLAGFSSRGPVVIDSSFRLKPNVSAPGVNVRSVVRGGGFAGFSGTSMAGPHVAGLVGLIISANPSLAGNVDKIEDIIEASAYPLTTDVDCGDFSGQQIPNALYGYGRVNALIAVNMALDLLTSTEDNNELENLRIFPNPTNDLITFHLQNSANKVENVSIYDIQGRLLASQRIAGDHILATLDIQSLPSGLYIYHVKSGDKQWNGKFIKQ